MRMQLFSKKNIQIFSDIDALAVSMSEKFFAQLSFKKARFPLLKENVTSPYPNISCGSVNRVAPAAAARSGVAEKATPQ